MSAHPNPDGSSAQDAVPIMLVHGWGGSFDATWHRTGFTALLDDAGRPVIGVDLLGHGTAPKPHDPAAYADMTERIWDAAPEQPFDAVGFSMGALTLLRAAADQPDRFRRLVLAGIGRNVFERDASRLERILAALEGTAPEDDTLARVFAQYADQPGNDPLALAAVLRADPGAALDHEALAQVRCPVLVIVGDQDFVYPADELIAALVDARSVVLRNVDHFATPESFGFIDATLEFLDAIPR